MHTKPNNRMESEKASELQADEYRILRGEIEERSKEQREMERNVVIITTAIISFLLVNPAQKPELAKLATLGWLIPPIVAFLALGRWLESLKMIKTLADYICFYEISIIGNKGAWEKRLRDERLRNELKFVSRSSIVFWLTMTGGPSALFARHLVENEFPTSRSGIVAIGAFLLTAGAACGLIKQSCLLDEPTETESPEQA